MEICAAKVSLGQEVDNHLEGSKLRGLNTDSPRLEKVSDYDLNAVASEVVHPEPQVLLSEPYLEEYQRNRVE